ncbi:MAG: DUF1800 domain-containing protein [Propionibacteriales bacterium]|nr:DUF1800 domain-containing protein [Propionibacteriales bacterium]
MTTYPATKVLDLRSLHIINRFTGGWTRGLGAQVTAIGGIDKWFARQLTPSLISDTYYTSSGAWWPSNLADSLTTIERANADIEPLWEVSAHYQTWSMVRRIGSQRQVLETMAAFWEHHFHVPTDGSESAGYRQDYGRTIRKLALGRFDTLLNAVSTHPAMGAYLGNATSSKYSPNENQGRELLELHTVGTAAGYTENDVKASARILTGWSVDLWDTWVPSYRTDWHWTGPVKVLGFTHPNTSTDGRAVTKAYLDYLARHPATARRIARKLAVHFVSDNPSNALVQHLATVYLANNTAIAPVLKALIATTEFRYAGGRKVRTPEEDIIATYRALGVGIARPTQDNAAANAMLWQCDQIGLTPFGWTRPDGRPDTADAWTSVSRMLGSFDVHYSMAGRWWPTVGATYKSPAAWLPQTSLRFDRFVDHLSRSILGRPASALILKVASQATGFGAAAIITKDHELIKWQMPRLLSVFLDSPQHLAR